MKNVVAAVVAAISVSGCVSQGGDRGFSLVNVVPGCSVLAYDGEPVVRQIPNMKIAFGIGSSCKADSGDDGYRIALVNEIRHDPSYARVSITDRNGSRTILVRRNTRAYPAQKFDFTTNWTSRTAQ